MIHGLVIINVIRVHYLRIWLCINTPRRRQRKDVLLAANNNDDSLSHSPSAYLKRCWAMVMIGVSAHNFYFLPHIFRSRHILLFRLGITASFLCSNKYTLTIFSILGGHTRHSIGWNVIFSSSFFFRWSEPNHGVVDYKISIYASGLTR